MERTIVVGAGFGILMNEDRASQGWTIEARRTDDCRDNRVGGGVHRQSTQGIRTGAPQIAGSRP